VPLELRPDSQFWYGRFRVRGERKSISLGIAVDGMRPAQLSGQGDAAFEVSRAKAQRVFDAHVREFREHESTGRLMERLIKHRSGERVHEVPIGDLYAVWGAIPREKAVSPKHAATVEAVFKRFASFVAQQTPNCRYVSEVTATLAEKFFAAEVARGVTAKTTNGALLVLRRTFAHLGQDALVMRDPFERIPKRRLNTISRVPLLPEQIVRLVAVSERHRDIRPLFLLGLCTAMRRADCCNLTWRSVNLSSSTIRIKTQKTGSEITIPIFPLLHTELSARAAAAGTVRAADYIFPELATMNEVNPDGISWRYHALLKDAGFSDVATEDAGIEVDAVRQKRKDGLRAASLRGFHALRTTWVTFALAGGIPMDVVRLVTGHHTAEVVYSHYFKPNAAQYRSVLLGGLPAFITGAAPLPSADWREVIATKLRAMTAENWAKQRDELLASVEQAEGALNIVAGGMLPGVLKSS
jgi:integrase